MEASLLPKTLVWALVLVTLHWAEAQKDLCNVDCSGATPPIMTRAADPTNCRYFYYCFSETEHSKLPIPCPKGQKFDDVTKACMDPGTPEFQCVAPCEPCSFNCVNSTMGRAADRLNCDTYYDCESGVITAAEKCKRYNSYFDGNECQSDKTRCCSCRPPECSEADVATHKLVPDHFNCTNFYMCIFIGLPDETSHGHCPPGMKFSTEIGGCDRDVRCVQPCAL